MSGEFALNQQLADKLREAAALLEQQGANAFRVQAYRRAAVTLVERQRDVDEILAQEGVEGLIALPRIGDSITARAHALGRTHDWVVVYFFRHDDHREGQRTIVTESRGPLTGQRVVRGREPECHPYYTTHAASPSHNK